MDRSGEVDRSEGVIPPEAVVPSLAEGMGKAVPRLDEAVDHRVAVQAGRLAGHPHLPGAVDHRVVAQAGRLVEVGHLRLPGAADPRVVGPRAARPQVVEACRDRD